jgi:hypothetical protein
MPRLPRHASAVLAVGSAAIALSLVALYAATPSDNHAVYGAATAGAERQPPQTLTVPDDLVPASVVRDGYSVTPGHATYVAGGTNHDWAKLVLNIAGWPVTENNVTVITRWMRQENYIDSWWNRNNPLNNGWGSGGGSGLGSYPSLQVAAENAVEALNSLPGYRPIVEAFAASAPTDVTERAIWASPWASSHYNNGAHWHYTPVPVIKAPPGAW